MVLRNPHVPTTTYLKTYIIFHSVIRQYFNSIIIADFNQIITDFGSIVAATNRKYGTSFAPFHHSEENVQEVFRRIEQINNSKNDGRLLMIAKPTEVKERIKPKVRAEMAKNSLFSKAETIYFSLVCQKGGANVHAKR